MRRSKARPLTSGLSSLRGGAFAIAQAAIAAVDADACVRRGLLARVPHSSVPPRWHVLSVGKAARPMLTAALAVMPTRPAHARLCGLPGMDAGLPSGVDIHHGGHPVPNEGSVAAGLAALAVAAATGPDDFLLVLLSGGASALLAAPADGLTLADTQQTTMTLLRAGANIYALNAVRKHLSRTKGGRLAAAARTVCLVISDVVGDDPSVIGSGLTVCDATTFSDALAVLDRFGGRPAYPPSVVARLERGARTGVDESPEPGAPALARGATHVIASRVDALRGAFGAARYPGYEVRVVEEPVVGEARDVSRAQ